MSESMRDEFHTVQLRYGGIEINNDDALAAFKELADKYFNQNFGTMMKSEINLVMFKCFDRAAIGRDANAAPTDYTLSRQLALTPQRVQNLRTKLALRGNEIDRWQESFLKVLESDAYRMVSAKGEKSCEMRLMFSSKADVFAFQDALISRKLFFDGSFNNMIVTTSLSAVLRILIEEVAKEEASEGMVDGGLVRYILNAGKVRDLPSPVREKVDELKAQEFHQKAAEASLPKALASGLAEEGVREVGAFLVDTLERFCSDDAAKERGGPAMRAALDVFTRVAKCLGSYDKAN